MTVLTFPTLRGASTMQWGLIGVTQIAVSPFDGTVQTLAMPGARWRGAVSWSSLGLAEWRTLTAFLTSLGGRAGRFTFSPPQGWRRATVAIPGTVRVNGAGQVGTSLAIDGLPSGVVVFEVGDWISFPNAAARPQLHQITAQATSNGSGQVTLSIAPPMRGSPADNAVITHTSPLGVFMLTGDDQGMATHAADAPRRAAVSIEIEEALA